MFSDYLSIGIMNIAHIFNPDKILLAGGIIEYYPDILEIVREKQKSYFPLPLRDLKIDMARLGSWSGAFGALAFAEGHSS
jgi:Transcriptional regulator/sugar kinase